MAEKYLIKQRNLLAGSVFVLSAFWGFHSALNLFPQSVDSLISLIIAEVITLCFLADARVQHKPFPVLSGWLVLMIWPLVMPVGLFWLYGRRKSLHIGAYLSSPFSMEWLSQRRCSLR